MLLKWILLQFVFLVMKPSLLPMHNMAKPFKLDLKTKIMISRGKIAYLRFKSSIRKTTKKKQKF